MNLIFRGGGVGDRRQKLHKLVNDLSPLSLVGMCDAGPGGNLWHGEGYLLFFTTKP